MRSMVTISPRRCTQPLGSPSTSAQRTHRMTGELLCADSYDWRCLNVWVFKLVNYIVFLNARHIDICCSNINQSCTIETDFASTYRYREEQVRSWGSSRNTATLYEQERNETHQRRMGTVSTKTPGDSRAGATKNKRLWVTYMGYRDGTGNRSNPWFGAETSRCATAGMVGDLEERKKLSWRRMWGREASCFWFIMGGTSAASLKLSRDSVAARNHCHTGKHNNYTYQYL